MTFLTLPSLARSIGEGFLACIHQYSYRRRQGYPLHMQTRIGAGDLHLELSSTDAPEFLALTLLHLGGDLQHWRTLLCAHPKLVLGLHGGEEGTRSDLWRPM